MSISIFSEIPEPLYESLQQHLAHHPQWDNNRVITAALALYLLHSSRGDRRVAVTYLETLYGREMDR